MTAKAVDSVIKALTGATPEDAASAESALASVLELRPTRELVSAAMVRVFKEHESQSADLGRMLAGSTPEALQRMSSYRLRARQQWLEILVRARLSAGNR
ncbi:MAG: hypothetical protein JWP31_350 [Aeromicrobium sp.]|nr:hypothetical protein [Aeromicrobium sp.]